MWKFIARAILIPLIYALVACKGPDNSFISLIILTTGYILTGGRHKWIYILYKTLPRDMKILKQFIRLQLKMKSLEKERMTAHRLFSTFCRRHPAKTAFYYNDQSWAYQQLDDFSGQIASNFYNLGYKRGDVIAIVCGNRPEYVGLWLGLSRVGIVAALVNSNLRKQPLLHSLSAALDGKCKAVIVEQGELAQAVNEVKDGLPPNVKLFHFGSGENYLKDSINLDEQLEKADKSGPGKVIEAPTKTNDKLLYIYTSGTTGLPKAAVITHLRFFFMSLGVNYTLKITPADVIYNSLPLYHTAGGMIGVGQVLLGGVTMALRRKFSVTGFWTDCIKYHCTVAQYIGEICRYLLSAPERREDKEHNIRLMFGNGLRPQIWESFVNRFNIGQIGEFYGATEGNSNIVNCDNTVGAVGFVPRYAGPIYPLALVRVNEETEEPIRDSNGLCIRCKPGEPGLFVGKIRKAAVSAFHGYADKKASEKKILKDVFTHGDVYFNSGDILVSDELGYFYFKDRTGDTFRWKGENVATSEIEAVISNVAELSDAVVYGVEIAGAEGRAGMAAVVGEPTEENITKLTKGINSELAAYARPLFLRVLKELPMTGTFKLKKRDLQIDGYNPSVVKDSLFFLDLTKGKYVPLTTELYQDILDKKVKL